MCGIEFPDSNGTDVAPMGSYLPKFTPVEPITQTFFVGGWGVTIEAPRGVEKFDVQSLRFDIIETQGKTVPRNITLEASV